MVGRLVFDETLVPRVDVLASLASQKINVEGWDLKQPERDVVFVTFPKMMQALAPGGLVGGTAEVDAWWRRCRKCADRTGKSQWQGRRGIGERERRWK